MALGGAGGIAPGGGRTDGDPVPPFRNGSAVELAAVEDSRRTAAEDDVVNRPDSVVADAAYSSQGRRSRSAIRRHGSADDARRLRARSMLAVPWRVDASSRYEGHTRR
jgi:hypothetical protein